MNTIKRLKLAEIVLIIFAIFFSWFLMSKTFRLDSDSNMEIALKVWSDFAATIPLIRSFSLGSNFPPEYPLFAGPPIRYHFAFAWVVGMLEKLGLPLDLALNIPSAIAFTILLLAIYFLAKTVFKSKAVGFLSVILFLFNASLSFLEFFKLNPPSLNSLQQITTNTEFSSFGPYDGKIVSAFWNLNIYTNQRHLALAFAAFLLILGIIYVASRKPNYLTNTKLAFIIMVIGLFPFIHLAIWGAMGIALAVSFIIFPKIRKKLLIIGMLSFIISLPQILYMGSPENNSSLFHPGFLVEKLTIQNFTTYWLYNLGLTLILLPAALYITDKNQRKLFIIFATLFIIGNLFQFSKEIAANHKLFNLFIVGTGMYIANLLVHLWKKSIPLKGLVIFFTFFLTISGIIDIFPIFNDRYVTIEDSPNNKAVNYIVKHTPKDSVFLVSTFLYDPASLAGRGVYLGWPYFSWSAGYDTDSRWQFKKAILASRTKPQACAMLGKLGIDYVEILSSTPIEEIPVNYQLFETSFTKAYNNKDTGFSIYDVKVSCKNV